MKTDKDGLLCMMPDKTQMKGLTRCGRSTREELRSSLLAVPVPPDVIAFTADNQLAVWVIKADGTSGMTLDAQILSAIRSFWSNAERIIGATVPEAGEDVNSAVAKAYKDMGDDVWALPCSTGMPYHVFTNAATRARMLIKRDVPLLGRKDDDPDKSRFVVLWDLVRDTVWASVHD